MSKVIRIIIMVLMCLFLIGASVSSLTNPKVLGDSAVKAVQKKLNKADPNGVTVASNDSVTKVITDINSLPLTDNADIYQYDDPSSVVTMYVTVRKGTDLENTNHTWKEVNDATKFFFQNMQQVIVPKADAILQIGDEHGPLPNELGYGQEVSNATIQIRGNSSSMLPQKSYKIELFDGAGEWRGQKTIDLNKHVPDITRVKNKLSFDLMKTIPDMVSLRTQFVHLYVKDETANPAAKAFEDYGLFTQIEQPNKKFLKNHLLDRYGQLYKTVMFEFERYPDQIRKADDPLYSEEEFSKVLEIKGNKDSTKLIEMLDAVNDWAIPIEDTFKKYFDENNYFTWMAFNILVENVDTNAQNFFLYSPQNSHKWYFLPWDYDGALGRQYDNLIFPYEHGIADYWGVVLHRRVLMVPEYRQKLDDKVRELLDILTPERLNNMLNVYRPATESYVSRMPDLYYLPGTMEDYDKVYSMIPDEPQANYKVYQQSLDEPMPFFLDTPQDMGDQYRFSWGESYDFNAEDITYHFMVSTSWDFKHIIRDVTLKNTLYTQVPKLDPGIYYWRVIAVNEKGKTQPPFDYYIDSDGVPHFGMKYLYVSPDGKILEKQKE